MVVSSMTSMLTIGSVFCWVLLRQTLAPWLTLTLLIATVASIIGGAGLPIRALLRGAVRASLRALQGSPSPPRAFAGLSAGQRECVSGRVRAIVSNGEAGDRREVASMELRLDGREPALVSKMRSFELEEPSTRSRALVRASDVVIVGAKAVADRSSVRDGALVEVLGLVRDATGDEGDHVGYRDHRQRIELVGPLTIRVVEDAEDRQGSTVRVDASGSVDVDEAEREPARDREPRRDRR